MAYKIVRHTPFAATYIYIDAQKALRKVLALGRAGSHFVILDERTNLPMTIGEIEDAAGSERT